MTKLLLTRCAAVAIAASAALPATAVLAQDTSAAQPVVVLPDPAPMPAKPVNAAPTITLPSMQSSSTPAASPVVVPSTMSTSTKVPSTPPDAIAPVAPATPVPPVATTRRETSTRTTAVRRDAVTAAPKQSAATATAPAATFVAPVDRPATSPSAQPEPRPAQAVAADNAAETQANAQNNQLDGGVLAGIAGALGLVVIGGLGFVAMRRRRNAPPYADASEPYVDDEMRAESVTPVTVASEEPIVAEPRKVTSPFANRIAPPIADAGYARHPLAKVQSPAASRSDRVILPPSIPESFEERDALLKRLIAAKPDRANPFHSRRARAHRAKLIIQSLDRNFEKSKPRIDLSQYSDRWPALRGWQPATA